VSEDGLKISGVLNRLKPEFPDLTISKIRFLESEGLITPQYKRSSRSRSQDGQQGSAYAYRLFNEEDIQRLRAILRMQRDEYLPLKVIRGRLDREAGSGGVEPEESAEAAEGEPAEEFVEPASGLQMSVDEMAAATGISADQIKELESFRLVCSHGPASAPYYDGDDHAMLVVLKSFLDQGFQARQLGIYRRFAEQEADLFESKVSPMMRRRNPEARREAVEMLKELSRAGRRLKQELLRINLKDHLADG
jgi:DNA-binding transcriptional MerR regulator